MSITKNEGDHKTSFSNYYLPNVEIKYFNVLIDGKSFFDLPVKNEEEAYDQITEMSRDNGYATGNLLDFAYIKNNYKLIAIDLSEKTKLKKILDKLILLADLKRKTTITMEQKCFSSVKNQKKCLQISVNII